MKTLFTAPDSTPARDANNWPTKFVAAGFFAATGGWLILWLIPRLRLEVFARGSAYLASLCTGIPVMRVDEGWMLPGPVQPVVVTVACSASDYFLILASLISWQLARAGKSPAHAVSTGLAVALLLAPGLNALRVIAVMQAHRWLIPVLPQAYGHFMHMLTGVAIFLPALIALNLLLELYGNRRSPGHARK